MNISLVFDLVFVLDSSGSLGETNWQIVKQFASDLVEFLPVGENDVRSV
jgi:hypothetical protein